MKPQKMQMHVEGNKICAKSDSLCSQISHFYYFGLDPGLPMTDPGPGLGLWTRVSGLQVRVLHSLSGTFTTKSGLACPLIWYIICPCRSSRLHMGQKVLPYVLPRQSKSFPSEAKKEGF